MNFKKMMAIFIYYSHNFKILHWKIKGHDFEIYHELTSKYYDQLDSYVDVIAEIGLTYDEQPLDLMEAYDILKTDEGEFKILKGTDDYSSEDVIEDIDIMFESMMVNLRKLLEEEKVNKNPGVKAKLETIYEWLDLEKNYKNKRRKK